MSVKLKSYLYMKYAQRINRNLDYEKIYCKNGALFAYYTCKRYYRTKISREDLPEWYIPVYIYSGHGFLSAKGVKGLSYKPSYDFENHIYKDDCLFISYSSAIPKDMNLEDLFNRDKYNHCLWGSDIVEFIKAVKKYSDIDVTDIETALNNKRIWYQGNMCK